MTNSTAEILKTNIPTIINIWEQRVLTEVKAAHFQKSLVLRNSLDLFLDQLVEELSEIDIRSNHQKRMSKERSTRIGKQHGKSRAESINYTIDQLIFEYHVLRETIFMVLEKHKTLTSIEREILITFIENAVNDAATEFSDTLKKLQDKISHTLIHDLRNPLTVAKTCAELISKFPNDSKNSFDKANRISNSVDRIDKLIQDLLNAANIKAGEQLSQNFDECDFDWIIKDVALEFSHSNPDRLIIHSEGECIGYWDESGIRRIVENLTNNALKHGKINSPIIMTLEDNDDSITFKIHNEGSPISPEDKEKLFLQFHQSEEAKNKTGWGIGLIAVKSIVDAHKGSITVESLENKGTVFTIKLPKNPIPSHLLNENNHLNPEQNSTSI